MTALILEAYGEPVTFTDSDVIVTLSWMYRPANGSVLHTMCYHLTAFNDPNSTEVYMDQNNGGVFYGGLDNRGCKAVHGQGILNISIPHPTKMDEGWYRCQFHTDYTHDVIASVHLTTVNIAHLSGKTTAIIL